MFNKNYLYMFIIVMMTGTSIVASSSTWATAWMGLEINLMSVIPILTISKSIKSMDSTIKYFIIQTISSSLIMVSFVSQIMSPLSFLILNTLLIQLSLMIKAAIAPMHSWLPNLIQHSEWPQILMILTWQKIAPLWLMSSCYMNNMVCIAIALSAVLGGLGGILMNSIKKIIAFSSVTHSSWMMVAIFLNKTTWLIYFMVYSLMLKLIIMMVSFSNINSLNKMSLKKMSSTFSINLIMSILSLAGLPPLMGFFPKLLVIQTMLNTWPNLLIISTLIMSTIMSLIFYLKMIISNMLNPAISKNNMVKPKKNLSKLTAATCMGNVILPLMLTIA